MPGVTEQVTMKGNPVTFVGKQIEVGQPIPDATLVANDLSEVKLHSFKGKNLIISVVPSLDTPVCDLQTKRFNQEAANLKDIEILTISVDLPFAQKRWCGANGNVKIKTLSDYRYASFGEAFGLLIKNLRLLARAVYVVDSKGIVRYREVVKEVTTEPNYTAALDAVNKL